MRAVIAVLIAAVILTGSAVAVAQNADTEGAERARMVALLQANAGEDCDCTSSIRAKERVADGRAG
jgi:hypothetical protein